jgi:AraC-like DNA-binding protein
MKIDIYSAVQELLRGWKHWDDVDRGEAIVRLRRARLSVRTLADVAGCSEGLVRRLEVVGHLPTEFKQRIRAGEPTSRFVAWARASRIAGAIGMPNR